MNLGKALAIANIVLATGACIGYLCVKDYRHAIYWFAAAVLTSTVTF